MSNLSALVIEDDRDVAAMFAETLQIVGCKTEIIHTGDVALARLAATVPDAVVLDLHLPRVEGMDILHQIRADARLSETRVIVVTGDPPAAEGLHDLADLIFVKPVGFGQLFDLATSLISDSPDK